MASCEKLVTENSRTKIVVRIGIRASNAAFPLMVKDERIIVMESRSMRVSL